VGVEANGRNEEEGEEKSSRRFFFPSAASRNCLSFFIIETNFLPYRPFALSSFILPLIETRVGASTAAAMAMIAEDKEARREREEEGEGDKGDDKLLLRRAGAAEARAGRRGCEGLLLLTTSALVLAVHVAEAPRMAVRNKERERSVLRRTTPTT